MRACNNLPQPNPYILDFGGCGRLLHALTPPRSAFLYLQFLARCHPYILLHFYILYLRLAILSLLRQSTPSSGHEIMSYVGSCAYTDADRNTCARTQPTYITLPITVIKNHTESCSLSRRPVHLSASHHMQKEV